MALNRPQHDDFWLLAQAVQDNDAGQDNHTIKFEDRLKQVVDPESLTYMAQQRALRVTGPYATVAELSKYAALFMDGFMAGAAFQASKDRVDTQHVPNSLEEMN